MINSFFIAACILILSSAGTAVSAAMTDKATGISFAPKAKGLDITGVGVRKKGPLKIYSVGMYASESLKKKLNALSRTAERAKALATLASAKDDGDVAFILKMNFKVGAEKISSAIADSVAPRHSGDASEVQDLKKLIFDGVSSKGAATPGTSFEFDCLSSGVTVAVDGNEQGCVHSSGLSQAFCQVYLDEKGVSPALKESCLETCCRD